LVVPGGGGLGYINYDLDEEEEEIEEEMGMMDSQYDECGCSEGWLCGAHHDCGSAFEEEDLVDEFDEEDEDLCCDDTGSTASTTPPETPLDTEVNPFMDPFRRDQRGGAPANAHERQYQPYEKPQQQERPQLLQQPKYYSAAFQEEPRSQWDTDTESECGDSLHSGSESDYFSYSPTEGFEDEEEDLPDLDDEWYRSIIQRTQMTADA
jgi:hypothetical protein